MRAERAKTFLSPRSPERRKHSFRHNTLLLEKVRCYAKYVILNNRSFIMPALTISRIHSRIRTGL